MTMKTYSDEQLNYYGDIYLRLSIKSCGIPFNEFLLVPNAIIEACKSGNRRPLLVQQKGVIERIRQNQLTAMRTAS